MCGITGLITGRTWRDGRQLIRAMTAAIAHRGPDSDGHWSEQNVHFGHRRLAIVELTPAGHQPMVSANGRFVLTYNGEIYNHHELRAKLDRVRTIRWRGNSDTETLLEALGHWGIPETLRQVSGMFAFALWDRLERSLTLARDPFGEKPLLYFCAADAFAFASEFRALEEVTEINTSADPACVARYLSRWYVPSPNSISKDVHKLPPGSYLTWRAGIAPNIQTYWSIDSAADNRYGSSNLRSEQSILDELGQLLDEAVKSRMMSDVPLGALLSGGVDSSLVVALMQRHSSKPIKTFCIGFTEQEFDEAPFAREVSRQLGTEHHELYVTVSDALNVVPRLSQIYDEPFADSSQIPTVIVCQYAREQVKVVLTGEGGDELFAGYGRYPHAMGLWSRIGKLPMRSVLGTITQAIPAAILSRITPLIMPLVRSETSAANSVSKIHRTSRMLRSRDFLEFYQTYIGTSIEAPRWLKDADQIDQSLRCATTPSGFSDLQKMLWYDTTDLLPNDLLVKVDRASMAMGLEGRMPLLDTRVAHFAWSMADSLKLRNSVSKWPLKALLGRHLPENLVNRPKRGFGIPLDLWLRTGLRAWASDLLSHDRLARQALFDADRVNQAWTHFLSRRNHSSTELWSLLMIQSWLAARGR